MTTELRDTIIKNLKDKGYSLRQIGETFNISHEKVRQILDKKNDKAKIKKGRPINH